MRGVTRFWRWVMLVVALCAALLGCEASSPGAAAAKARAAQEAVEGVICPAGKLLNFTDDKIGNWYVYNLDDEKLGGSFGGANERPAKGQYGMGHTTRCVELPRRWDEGDTYVLRWQSSGDLRNEPIVRGGNWWAHWYRATVKMPPYSPKTHDLGVFLFEDHKVCISLASNDAPLACVDVVDDDLQPQLDSPYIAQGALDEVMNASARVYWESQDMELMERRRKTARVNEWITAKYGEEASGVVVYLDLLETEEWFMANRPAETEYGQNESKKALEKFRLELKEREAKYGRTAKSLINADSIQEAKPEREFMEKQK